MRGNRISTSDVSVVTGLSKPVIRALMEKERLGVKISHHTDGKRARDEYIFSVYKIAEFLKVPVWAVKAKFEELGRTFI